MNFTSKKQNEKTFYLLILLISFMTSTTVFAQETEEIEDKTTSPFFYVQCTDSTIDALPLKSTNVNVNISGVIADATIRQRYVNTGEKTIEAKYIFPLSTKAAVYYLKMYIGNRIITAVVKEKEQAQQEYEEAIENGQTATLLEQQRPNVVQMKVGNIMPGDTIDIEIKYTELITSIEGIYEYVYPTVVGPRYFSPSTSDQGDSVWIEVPYTYEGEAPLSTFDIDVTINGGMPISAISCPSHDLMNINYVNESTAECSLPDEDSLSGNKDFILDYTLVGEGHKTGMLLYEGEEENFFLSMIQPPAHPTADQVPNREYVFILDVSGSMSGFPLETSKSLITSILSDLNVTDKFNILCFAGGSNFLFDESEEATAENISYAIDFIESLYGGGGTRILYALQKALTYPVSENYARTFVIATDGYVSVEKQTFDLIKNNLNKANFFAFGIGSSVNRYIIEGIAHVGMGEPFIVTKPEEAEYTATLFKKYVETPVLTNVTATLSNFNTYDVEPRTIPDVFAERPVIMFGKYQSLSAGTIQIDGVSGTSNFSNTLNVSDYEPTPQNYALRYLWARYKIQQLDDYQGEYGDSNKEEILALGLKYNLLTRYTSFIAIDSVIRNENGELTTVVVPNPMPEGVSNNAIGGDWGAVSYDAIEEYQPKESAILHLYPNPFISNTTLVITLLEDDLYKSKTVEVFDASGKLITSMDVSSLDRKINQITLPDTQQLHKGVYFITLRIDGVRICTSKLIKL